MSRRRSGVPAALAAALGRNALGACGDDTVEGPPPSAPERIRLTSSAFGPGESIPVRVTCDGDDVSPPLDWSGVPPVARSLALLMEDPDAPGGTFVHWTLFALAPDTAGLREGKLPRGALEGENSFGENGYRGPCPPEGDEPHRYVFILYALRAPAEPQSGAAPEEVRSAVADGAIASGRLTGRDGR